MHFDATNSVVTCRNSLGKSVIAEGIETASQFAQLREMGCHAGQGFHMSSPLTPRDVEALLVRLLTETSPVMPPAWPGNAALVH